MQIQEEPALSQRPTLSPGENILNSIRRVVRALRVSSRAAEKDLGLSGAQLFVLQKLVEGKVYSINELAERTLTHQSSASAVVARLIDQGLVRRVTSRVDRRRRDVTLTAAGSKLLRKSSVSAQERLLEGISCLSRAEQRQLAELFEKMLGFAGLSAEPAAMFFEDESVLKSFKRGKQHESHKR